MKFWRLTLLQRSLVLIGASLLGFCGNYVLNILLTRKFMMESESCVLGSLWLPFFLLIIGTEGHLTDPDGTNKPELIKLWSILSVYFVLLSIAFYFQWLPVKPSLFVMPLTTIVVMLPWVLWQRSRMRRARSNRG